MAEHLASIFGTEKDRVNCPFYFKIGCAIPRCLTATYPVPSLLCLLRRCSESLIAVCMALQSYLLCFLYVCGRSVGTFPTSLCFWADQVFVDLLCRFELPSNPTELCCAKLDDISFPVRLCRACRHGDRCSRLHNRPTISPTLLLPNLYQNPALNAPPGPDGLPMPVDARKSQEHFEVCSAASVYYLSPGLDQLVLFQHVHYTSLCFPASAVFAYLSG